MGVRRAAHHPQHSDTSVRGRSSPSSRSTVDFGATACTTADRPNPRISAQVISHVIDRALHRLDDGTYGRSVLSGKPIPDERLEADPAAELTIEEAKAAEAEGR